MRTFSLFLLALPLLLFSCQETPAPPSPTLYGALYMRYLQDGNEVKAEASFFEEDSLSGKRPVRIEGGVAFLGSGMGMREFPDGQLVRYQYENRIPFPDEVRFQIRDLAGADQVFTHAFSPIDTFVLAPLIDRSQPATLQLPSGPLTETQELVFLLTDANAKATFFSIKGPSKSDKISISTQEWSKIEPGIYELYVVKKELVPFKRPGLDVQLSLEYYSKTRKVTLQ